MDGHDARVHLRGRALGALALTVLLWPLAGQANIPRIPFPELQRDEAPDLPLAPRWHAGRGAVTEPRTIELARVPEGAVRLPKDPARRDA